MKAMMPKPKASLLLLLLPLLFISSSAQFFHVGGSYGFGAGGGQSFGEGFKETLADPKTGSNDGGLKDGVTPKPIGFGISLPGFNFRFGSGQEEESSKREFETNYGGEWKIVSKDSGVSAMHINLLPKNGKMIIIDASAFHISNVKLPKGECLPFKNDKGDTLPDCWSHAVEYDIETSKIRPLKVLTDPWCSSGGLDVEGRLLSTGGWMGGGKAVRYIDACKNCDWKDYATALARPRWYATQATMDDGGFILVGGRRSYSVEFVPQEGKNNARAIKLPFLDETTDLDENNLYPFVYLSTDGNVFIFANSRSILLNPKSHAVIKEFPVLDGGSRNYPASGMSALLPIKLQLRNPRVIPAEVIVCGGAKPEAYRAAEGGNFMPALQDCARLDITKPNDVWKKEQMPSPRVMGDMMILPTGDLLMLNGAVSGTSAWKFAEGPNLTPVLYSPDKPDGERFKELNPSKIARMYHSVAAVLPDGKIFVGGSNTNPGYDFKAKYPTEMRIEKFSPPYLAPELADFRPVIRKDGFQNKWNYGKQFDIEINLKVKGDFDNDNDIKVTMYPPPFTTHGYSMNQRLIVLANSEKVDEIGDGVFRVSVVAPPSGVIAPPGYYLVFVVYRGIPSVGSWVQIK